MPANRPRYDDNDDDRHRRRRHREEDDEDDHPRRKRGLGGGAILGIAGGVVAVAVVVVVIIVITRKPGGGTAAGDGGPAPGGLNLPRRTAVDREMYNQLRIGMTPDEVTGILGEPEEIPRDRWETTHLPNVTGQLDWNGKGPPIWFYERNGSSDQHRWCRWEGAVHAVWARFVPDKKGTSRVDTLYLCRGEVVQNHRAGPVDDLPPGREKPRQKFIVP
jgi:hypothetical protein